MAVLDLIWMGISSAALLALVAIMGFITFRVGIISFKIATDAVGAVRGIENIGGVIKQPNHRIAAEKDEKEIVVSFIKAEIEKNPYANYYTNYAYNRFKVRLITSYINSFIIPKIEKINEKYESLFENEKVIAYINSFKSFMKAKGKKNFAKYAYIQLFKK